LKKLSFAAPSFNPSYFSDDADAYAAISFAVTDLLKPYRIVLSLPSRTHEGYGNKRGAFYDAPLLTDQSNID
jgi:hypothetical protein